MKLLLMLLLTVAAPAAAAPAEKFGVGGVLGVPFGVTAKVRIDPRWSVQSHLGVSDGDFTMNVDALKDFDKVLPRRNPAARMPLYAGLGLKYKAERDAFVGIRFVAGVSLYHTTKPYEFFAEIAPVLRLAPREGGAFDGAVGFRRWF